MMKLLLIFLLVFSSGSAVSAFNNFEKFFNFVHIINGLVSSFCDTFTDIKNVSRSCANQLKILCEDENRTTLIKMLDSSAFPIYSGMLYSSEINLGNFDECLSIEYHKNGFKILGNYCPIGYAIPSSHGRNYTFAICKPNKCSFKDILNIFGHTTLGEFRYQFLKQIGPFEQYCSTKEWEQLTLGNTITIGIFIVIGVVIIISTFYDVLCEKYKSRKQSSFIAFSAYTNTKKIFKVKKPQKGRITILDGIRSLSIGCIFAGHGYLAWQKTPLITNIAEVAEFLSSNGLHVVIGSYICVDTFFFMSGTLLAYTYFKTEPQSLMNQLKYIPLMYCYRLIRLFLPLLMIYLCALWIFPIIHSGPYWKLGCALESDKCKTHWLAFFTFTQNYVVSNNEICIVPLWYLAADMQMFIFAPIILIPLSFQLKMTNGYLMAILELLVLIVLATGLHVGFSLLYPDINNKYDTHSRVVDYLIGIMMGIFLRKGNKNYFNILNKHYLYILIWITVLICMSIVWWKQEFKINGTAYYLVYYRILWCFCLCWIIYASFHGYGGPIGRILNWPGFQIFSKLSYSIYLSHYLTLAHYMLTLRERVRFSHYYQFHLFCGYIIENFILSFIWTLAFDIPTTEIVKIWFKASR